MIKSCEDVTTMKDFEEFIKLRLNTTEVGLLETAGMLCWDAIHIIRPDRIETFWT